MLSLFLATVKLGFSRCNTVNKLQSFKIYIYIYTYMHIFRKFSYVTANQELLKTVKAMITMGTFLEDSGINGVMHLLTDDAQQLAS